MQLNAHLERLWSVRLACHELAAALDRRGPDLCRGLRERARRLACLRGGALPTASIGICSAQPEPLAAAGRPTTDAGYAHHDPPPFMIEEINSTVERELLRRTEEERLSP